MLEQQGNGQVRLAKDTSIRLFVPIHGDTNIVGLIITTAARSFPHTCLPSAFNI